jgi:methionyl aminopeptidase
VALIAATKEALMQGINAVRVGNRIGAIGDSIYRYAKDKGYKVIETYGGHGISDNTPHDQPFVSNRSDPSKGIKIQPGLTIAIEPMLLPYNSQLTTKVGSDGWTIYTEEIGAHEEHSVFVHEDHVEIITDRTNTGQ